MRDHNGFECIRAFLEKPDEKEKEEKGGMDDGTLALNNANKRIA